MRAGPRRGGVRTHRGACRAIAILGRWPPGFFWLLKDALTYVSARTHSAQPYVHAQHSSSHHACVQLTNPQHTMSLHACTHRDSHGATGNGSSKLKLDQDSRWPAPLGF